MDVDLVVFDMAGTTVHDPDGVSRCLGEALQGFGVKVGARRVNDVMGLPKPEAIRILLSGNAATEKLLPRVAEIHADFVHRMVRYYETDSEVREVPGAVDAFIRLRGAGIKVGLDTGFDRHIVQAMLRRLGWSEGETVDATVTSDEVKSGRPHPDMIFQLMRRLGVSHSERVVKVGDTPSDLEQGTRAGCRWVIGVTSGTHTRAQLAKHPHTHIVGSVAEVPDLLGCKN